MTKLDDEKNAFIALEKKREQLHMEHSRIRSLFNEDVVRVTGLAKQKRIVPELHPRRMAAPYRNR